MTFGDLSARSRMPSTVRRPLVMPAHAYQPDRSLPAKLRRRWVAWRAAKPLPRTPDRPIVSVTFDDFPLSAAGVGAEAVEAAGGRATFYASTGLLGTHGPTGTQASAADLSELRSRDHEIGAHTHSHLDCAAAPLGASLIDITRNAAELAALGFPAVESFAYPYGETRLALKRVLSGRFSTARGILPGINRKGSDAAQLRAFELDPDPATTHRAVAAVRSMANAPGWAIIFTHGVSEQPQPFGASLAALQAVLKAAEEVGALLLPVREAYAMIAEPARA